MVVVVKAESIASVLGFISIFFFIFGGGKRGRMGNDVKFSLLKA